METAPTFYDNLAQWSEVIGGFAFVIVAILLFRKYVLPAVKTGEASKNAELVLAEERRAELQTQVVRARAEIESADRDAIGIGERAQGDSTREYERIIAEAKADGERIVRNAEGELDRARMTARDQLRIELIEKALLQARREASSRLGADANAALVAKTVDDLAGSNGST